MLWSKFHSSMFIEDPVTKGYVHVIEAWILSIQPMYAKYKLDVSAAIMEGKASPGYFLACPLSVR